MAKTILPAGGGGGKSSVKLTITATASDSVALTGMTIFVKDRYTDELIKSFTYSGQPETVEIPVGMPYTVSCTEVTSYSTPKPISNIGYDDKNIVLYYQKGIRYGYKRTKTNSDSDDRITYLYDAVGMEPAYTDLTDHTFHPGDWENFINEVATPVMLDYDGNEVYELDRNNQTLKAGGNAGNLSDVASTAFNGNAMVRFEKFKWLKRYEDISYEYVIFCDVKFDDDYHDYAFINELGESMDRMYYGMYKGSNVNSKLRSIAGQSIMVSQTRNVEVTYARNNGTGYDTIYNSGWQYVADLLTLISKSDASQEKFGYGHCDASAAIKTGTTKGYPGFWGSSNKTDDVKVFWIEGFWGNVWEGMRGCILTNGTIHTKMVPPYNFDGADYTDTGIAPSGTSGGYINTESVTDESGFVPKTASGSATTYVRDGLWFNNGQTDYALVGGRWADALLCGSRYLLLNSAPSTASTDFGSRLSCIPLAA